MFAVTGVYQSFCVKMLLHSFFLSWLAHSDYKSVSSCVEIKTSRVVFVSSESCSSGRGGGRWLRLLPKGDALDNDDLRLLLMLVLLMLVMRRLASSGGCSFTAIRFILVIFTGNLRS